MRSLMLNVILALVWAALLGQFTTGNLIAGFVLGYLALWAMQDVLGASTYFIKVRQIITLVLVFLWALIQSNVRVAFSVLAPFDKMSPAIVAIPLDIESDAEITLLANMITLTPGTLSIDVSNNRKVLYVHGMHVYNLEAFKREIKEGFERRVKEAFE